MPRQLTQSFIGQRRDVTFLLRCNIIFQPTQFGGLGIINIKLDKLKFNGRNNMIEKWKTTFSRAKNVDNFKNEMPVFR